jgi:outer membrane protein, heavy metal efflux system
MFVFHINNTSMKISTASQFLGDAICVAVLTFCLAEMICCKCFAAESKATPPATDSKATPPAANSQSTEQAEYKQIAPERTLSLHASFDRAIESNKELIAAKYNLPISKAAIKMASAIPNPRFSLLYGFGPAFTVILAGNPEQFGWQQDIQTAGKRTKNINLAHANYRGTELQIAATLFDIHNRVRRAYAELAAAEAYQDLIEAERKVAMELMTTAQRRYEAGKAAQAEFLQAQMGVLQFETQRSQSQARLQKATVALSSIIGEVPQRVEVIDVDDNGVFKISDDHTELVPSPFHPLPPLVMLLPAAYTERPDMRVAIQQAFSDRKALTVAKAQRIPDILLDTGYQFSTFKKQQPYNLFPGRVPNQPGVYINVSAELPIYYQHQGEVAQAKTTWLQDFDQIELLKTQIATDVVTAYESVSVARNNIAKFQKELIPAAAEVARIARRSYQVGKSDLATAVIAKQQYQQTLTSYFDAVVNYQNSWADLEKATGAPLQL